MECEAVIVHPSSVATIYQVLANQIWPTTTLTVPHILDTTTNRSHIHAIIYFPAYEDDNVEEECFMLVNDWGEDPPFICSLYPGRGVLLLGRGGWGRGDFKWEDRDVDCMVIQIEEYSRESALVVKLKTITHHCTDFFNFDRLCCIWKCI